MKTREEILDMIEEEDVEFIRLQFTDVFGNLKNIAVTPGQFEKSLEYNYEIDGASMFDGKLACEEELYLKPDLDSFVILPWRPQHGKVGKFICDVVNADGSAFEISPRAILKKVTDKAKEQGYTFMVNPECEFFLFNTDESGNPTTISHEKAGYLDVGPLDFGENARRDMVLTLEEMGFEVVSSHHEKAPSQHEIDITADEALKTADKLVTLKFAVRSIAKRFGLYATFMPKPRTDLAGSAMHLNFTMQKDGVNVFNTDAALTKAFAGGILMHTKSMCALTNPTVNSYKRILADRGADAPIGMAEKNAVETINMRKLHGDTTVVVRFPDPSADPYLAIASCIIAGMDGLNLNNPDAAGDYGCLPNNLQDAVRNFKKDELLTDSIGKEFSEKYVKLKTDEWNDYMEQVSDWEVKRYLGRL